MINTEKLEKIITSSWDNRELLKSKDNVKAITKTIDLLDKGSLRVAEYCNNSWKLNEWIKKAVLLYFSIKKMEKLESGIFEYHDKVPLKNNYDKLDIRIVPGALARYGSYIAPKVIMMPSFVNIGAYVDENTMIDTWATVGSCAQIGKNVHISGGAGIGGVLEPVQANPVIIEDNCFIGSRSIIVEGVIIKNEAVLAANVVITSSTKIIDVSGKKPIYLKGIIPENSVVIPGTTSKKFNAGEYQIPCALIIGKRKESTDKKTSLNNALRDFNISV